MVIQLLNPRSQEAILGTTVILGNFWDEIITGTILDDDEAHRSGTAPTNFLGLQPRSSNIEAGILDTVAWRLNNANAVTHQMYIYENDEDDAELEDLYLIYSSDVGLAKDTRYMETGATERLPTSFFAKHAGRLWKKTDYSAAAGATTGFIKVAGTVKGM